MKKMRLIGLLLAVVFGFAVSPACGADSPPSNTPVIPTPGLVTLVDLGADKCIPCKMMAPILEELKKEYHGKASIIFIDVWKNPDEARRFGIQGIPTQIFFDKEGREAGRHVGFLDKKSIISAFEDLGVSGETKP
jgi:thioredoxin 1